LGSQSQKPAEQYMLFVQAASVARDGGDARLVREALDELSKRFDTDTTKMKVDELTKLAKAARDEWTMDSLVANVQPVVDQAIAEGKVDLASAFLDEVYSATQKPAGRRYGKVKETQKKLKTQTFSAVCGHSE
jgi:hypothetical protein